MPRFASALCFPSFANPVFLVRSLNDERHTAIFQRRFQAMGSARSDETGLQPGRRDQMISESTIQQAVARLVAAANPSKVILFGSYARGDATEDSDLDLMVIEPQLKDKFGEMVRLRQALRPLHKLVFQL